jgi:hypothetical protein
MKKQNKRRSLCDNSNEKKSKNIMPANIWFVFTFSLLQIVKIKISGLSHIPGAFSCMKDVSYLVPSG